MTTQARRPSPPALRSALLFAAGAVAGAVASTWLRQPPTHAVASSPLPSSRATLEPASASASASVSASVLGAASSSAPGPRASAPLAGAWGELPELDALKRLEGADELTRSADEALAIARGHAALALGDLASLSLAVAREPALAHDRATLARFHDFIEREPSPLEALAAVAALPGPESADLLHAVWRRRRHTTIGLLARDLVRGQAARSQASAALGVAVALEEQLEARPPEGARAARRCERVKALLAQVAGVGDRRCSPLLAELEVKRGCGGDGEADCYPCLRDDDALGRAKGAVKPREAPTPWVLARQR